MIKKTYVTTIKKQLSIYGSFSYFSGKTSATNIKLLSSNNFLKFLIDKRSLENNLKLQLAHVNGSETKTSDKKIHDFSITKLGKRKKNTMSEPIETIIVKAQQDFDVVGVLNPIQIEISDDRVINTLKKYKNVVYKIIRLGLLFPATITNETSQIFILSKNVSGVKKSILNQKVYDLLAIIEINKIDNWKDVKGKSIWTNVNFKDHTEINNDSHLCFPFATRSFSDLTSFSIFLQYDQNKKIEFTSGEKNNKYF